MLDHREFSSSGNGQIEVLVLMKAGGAGDSAMTAYIQAVSIAIREGEDQCQEFRNHNL
jgi:hypothetical protein